MEKPFGSDAASADKLNQVLTRVVREDQIFRVDHYLGMSTVLNILGLRYTNRMLESVLDSAHVASVDILLDESLALEGRAGYYDTAGALVDMLQSHALHVLSFLAMEPPSTIGPQDVRDGAAAVLRATRVRGNDPVGSSRRARYTAGRVGDRILPSYVDEDGVDPGRRTETLAEVVVEVNNWRWAGVPFRLRAGKAIRELDKRVVITFKEPNWVPEGLLGYERPDRIHIGLDPEVLRFDFNINGPADPRTVERVGMGVKLEPGDLPPYGQVLAGVLAGDPTLSVRGDQAVQTWRIVEPVLRAWRDGAVPLEEYEAGSDTRQPCRGSARALRRRLVRSRRRQGTAGPPRGAQSSPRQRRRRRCAAAFGLRSRVKTPFLFPPTRITPGTVAKSAKFHTCSPTTASIRSKTRWDIANISVW
jgi:glucose-6-phosphate 1-dehydrogenase